MKTKTKRILLIVLSLVFVFAFVACNKPDPTHTLYAAEPVYEAFVIAASDSASGTTYQIESDVKKTKEKVDTSVPQTASLTINGQKIEGTYSHSEMVFPNNFYRHVYYGDRKTQRFELDTSGRLLYLSWPEFAIKNVGVNERTQKECIALAKNFIRSYFSKDIDFSNYTLVETNEAETDYLFVFGKHIDGWNTTEQALVSINKDGSVRKFVSFMLDEVSVDRVPFDEEKTHTAMKEKLDAIYAETKTQWATVNYEDPKFYVTLLEDGRPAIYCTVTVRFETESGGTFGELVSMIIT